MGERYELHTKRGHDFYEVTSAMQKAIRRGDVKMAGYWGIELAESRFELYVWKRLLTISAEDCWGIITKEIQALYQAWQLMNDKADKPKGRIFIAKAIILLCLAKKSRDADHLTNLIYDADKLGEENLINEIRAAREEALTIPSYAHDVHTKRGRMMGKKKTDFFQEEFNALTPRVPGELDELVPK